MKKSKLFLLGSTILLAVGSFSMSACVTSEDDNPSGDDSTLPSDTGSDSDSSSTPSTEEEEEEVNSLQLVTLHGLNSYYLPSETIDWDNIYITLSYKDLTTVTLDKVEFDVDERESEETEFILYTSGLHEAYASHETISEGTYDISCVIYLDEEIIYRGAPTNISSVVVTQYPSQNFRVYSYSAPTLQETYEKNIAESVSEVGGSENEDKFYEEPEYYEVGDDNPFTYEPKLLWMNTQTHKIENPDTFRTDISVYHYNEITKQNEKLDLDNNPYVSVDGFDFQFDKDGDAVGEIFTISVALSDFSVDSVGNPIPAQTFTIKVEDGWNVYDELDLGRMNLVSEDFDENWIDSYNGGSGGSSDYRNTGWYTGREKNYEAKGRAFFENGTPGGYHIYANHYWVDEDGKEITDDSGFLCTDLDDNPEGADHIVYSLSYGSYDYTSANGHSGTNDSFAYQVKLDEYWYNFLSEKGKTDLHQVNGVFLHTDLKITEDCIPPEFLLSNEEAYQLGPDSAEGLNAWGDEVAAALTPLLKVSSDGEAYQYDDMDGSIRDRAYLYLHHMEDDFTLNGNLFTIDASKLKWCMNNVFLPSMNFYYTEETEFAIQSNACFLNFDYNREATAPAYNTATDGIYPSDRPEATVKNVRYFGNSRNYTEAEDSGSVRSGRKITNAEFASGCLSFIESTSVQTNVDNVICKDANIAFFGARVHTNDELSCFDINHTKVYDCYTTAFYLWCSGNTKVENSEFKRYGGPFSICISTFEGSNGMSGNAFYYQNDYTYVNYSLDSDNKLATDASGSRNITYGSTAKWNSNMILGDNVTVESYVGGTESWFVLNNATSVVTQVKGYDYLLNRAGKTMIASEDPSDDNYGKFNLKGLFMDTTYILSGQYALHGSYVSSVSDNYWNSEGGYAIDSGADTEMQRYIDTYAKWYYNIKIGEETTGTFITKTVDVTTDVSTPIFFTNTGNVFGFTEGEDVVSEADPVGDDTVLYDLKAYEESSKTTKTPAQFDKDDTEIFMVIPLQADLGNMDGDSITVDLYQIIVDVLAAEGYDISYDLVKTTVALLVLLGDETLSQWDDLTKVPLGDLLRLDYELDLSSIISGLKISIVVGMGDTLIGVVMDLYDYDSQA